MEYPEKALTERDLGALLESHGRKTLLRCMTCGSVDDGKSTLIGRLLYESSAIFDDQLAALASDSAMGGTRGGDLDFALLVDGLIAEREQKITIDVAYRFFSTAARKYILADTPGHEQYTRNMVTGASTADVAIVLVDARKGVVTQTRRHTFLISLLGIRDVVLAVNKMDLVDCSPTVFGAIENDFREFGARVGLRTVTAIPVVAVYGDNIVAPSERMPWYRGPSLLPYLDAFPLHRENGARPFRMPVQCVLRPDARFRGFAGMIVSGSVSVGTEVVVLPSNTHSRIARILVGCADVDTAGVGQSVTMTLADDADVGRGSVVATPTEPPGVADQFEATIIWLDERPLLPGRSYLVRVGTQTVGGSVSPLKYKINVDTLEHLPSKTLELNEIGVGVLQLHQPVAFEAYADSRDLGGCVLIDRMTNATIGAGLLHFALRRANNLHWQELDIDRTARASAKGQQPCVVWFTGVSGAGKSTIANILERRLYGLGRHTYLLDGDNVRHGLNRDLGFSEADRVENIRRVAEVARLMTDAGLIVLVSFISPFRAERRAARELNRDAFLEVFVDTPLEIAESRDTKGLYSKARAGLLKNFTGIDSPYERPERPELTIDTTRMTAEQAADAVLEALAAAGIINRE